MKYTVVVAEVDHQSRTVALLPDPTDDQLTAWMSQYLTMVSPGAPRPRMFRTTEFDMAVGPEPVMFSQRVWPVTRPATGPWGGRLLV